MTEERLGTIYDVFSYLNLGFADRSEEGVESLVCKKLSSKLYNEVWTFRKTSENRLKYLNGSLDSKSIKKFEENSSEIFRQIKEGGINKIDDGTFANNLEENLLQIPISYKGLVYRHLMISTNANKLSEREVQALENLADGLGIVIKNQKAESLIYSNKNIRFTIEFTTPKISISKIDRDSIYKFKVEHFKPLEGDSNKYSIRFEDPKGVEEILDRSEIVKSYEAIEDNRFEVITKNDRLRRVIDTGSMIFSIEFLGDKVRLQLEIPKDGDRQVLFDVLDTIADDWKVVKKELKSSKRIVSTEEKDWGLTEKQLDALKKAYVSGYYDNPRKANAKEIASKLGISDSTLFQHLQAAHRKMIREFLGPEIEEKRLSENAL